MALFSAVYEVFLLVTLRRPAMQLWRKRTLWSADWCCHSCAADIVAGLYARRGIMIEFLRFLSVFLTRLSAWISIRRKCYNLG